MLCELIAGMLMMLLPPQWVEDPIAHAAVRHAAPRVNLSRAIPCPLGCGDFMFARHPRTKLHDSEIEQHTLGDTCKARMELVRKARAECEQFLASKAAAEV